VTLIIDGRIIHFNNCTYCVFRQQIPVGTKTKKRELEICGKDNHPIPHPFNSEGLQRYCSSYRQRDCECDKCQVIEVTFAPGIPAYQLVNGLDK
jgi:hypothetical protein